MFGARAKLLLLLLGLGLGLLTWTADAAVKMPKMKKIPSLYFQSDEAATRIRRQKPVILTGTGFVQTAVDTWSPEYLLKHWDGKRKLSAIATRQLTKAGKHNFRFIDRAPVSHFNRMCWAYDARGSTGNITSMKKFLSRAEQRAADGVGEYIQDALMKQADDIGWRWGDQIEEDVMSFNWDGFVKHLSSAHGWWRNEADTDDDPKSFSNKLWLSDTAKAVTPLHFDIRHNMHAQIRGEKRFWLWPPSEFYRMCALPRGHPYDRGSHIADLQDVPKRCKSFSKAKDGLVGTLSPGEVLYIPFGWWHHVETTSDVPFPMSFAIDWRPRSQLGQAKPLTHDHDLMRRRLEVEIRLTYNLVTGADNPAEMLGAAGSVEYLQAVGAGEFDKDLPDARLTKIHEKILPELSQQLIIMNVLKPDETAYQFLKWMTKNGRFDMPTTEYPLHHITEHNKQPTSTVEDGMIAAKKKERGSGPATDKAKKKMKKKKKKKKNTAAEKATAQTKTKPKEDL